MTELSEELLKEAEAAYDREDQAWFNGQSTEVLSAMWAIACDISRGAAWDDEVYEALAARGFFDEKPAAPAPAPARADIGFYRCPKCGHAPHKEPCLNMASDNDCECPGGFESELVPPRVERPPRLTVERPGKGPTALIFVHASSTRGGAGRSTYTLSQREALALADELRAAVAGART